MLYRFQLTYDSVTTQVDEPQNFKDFESEINRDFKSHGTIYQFTSGTLTLGFIGTGRTILETAFQEQGIDAVVTLQVDKRPDIFTDWVQIFSGTAAMENRDVDIDYFRVDFENTTFADLIRNNFNTRIDLGRTDDLNGNALVGSLTSYTSTWNDIAKRLKWIANYKNPPLTANTDTITHSPYPGGDVTAYWTPSWNDLLLDDAKTAQDVAITTTLTTSKPGVSDAFFISDKGGDIEIAPQLDFSIIGTACGLLGGGNFTFAWTWVLEHYNAGDVLQDTFDVADNADWGDSTTEALATCPTQNSISTGQITTPLTEISISGTNVGDKFVFYLKLDSSSSGDTLDASGTNQSVTFHYNSKLEFRIVPDLVPFEVKNWLIFDVLDRLTYIITGVQSSFWSDFFALTEHGAATDGCGGLQMLTNGAQIRGIDNDLVISLKEILESEQAFFNIGWSIEDSYDGVDFRFRSELMEFYYSDSEILDLGNVTEFKAEVFDELTWNTAKVGYSKFSSDEDLDNNIQDYLTEIEWVLPTRKVESKFERKSELIASGELIKATYDKRNDVSKAWKFDENNFICLVERSGNNFIPENNENFDTVTGLVNATTAYNLRISPVYMLVNQALLLNSGFLGKNIDSEKVRNVATKINRDFTSQMTAGFSCILKDNASLRTATGDIAIFGIFEGLRLFEPTKHTFKVALTTTQLDLIVQALQNNLYDDNRNFGYLSYTDEDGNVQEGFPLNIKWSPVTEIATIETVERSDVYFNA